MGENWAVYTPSEMGFLSLWEADTGYLFQDKKTDEVVSDKSHTANRQQSSELGLESCWVRGPGGESQELSHLESWQPGL